MSRKATVLLVEDSPALAETYKEYLKREPCELVALESGKAAIQRIDSAMPDAVLLDLGLPDMNGMDILKLISERRLPIVTVVITAQGSINVAVEAMRYGAADFLVKPFTRDRLIVTLRNALERSRLEEIVETYRQEFDHKGYQGVVGSSLAMQAVYRIIGAAASSKAAVFITGESGTGKELCAEAIHRQGSRRDKAFVALNCAAIPKDLIESEIFGHVKGAFTGAVADREGAAARARGGTLFLDEICEMDINLQSKLLRFIQTGAYQKVGSNRAEEADVRFVCATNRDPLREVAAGRFREDLYYRLHVIPVQLPPLREREGDVLPLAEHFLKRFSGEEGKAFKGIEPLVAETLCAYSWPGNVRQLENVIRNIVVLHNGPTVTRDMLPPPLNQLAESGPSPAPAPLTRPPAMAAPPAATVQPISEAPTPAAEAPATTLGASAVLRPLWIQEKEIIEKAIEACDGNIPRAAAHLEVSPSTIYRKKQAWGEG